MCFVEQSTSFGVVFEDILGWGRRLSDHQRTQLLAGIRAFLQECPASEAKLDQVENVRQSCCAGELVSVSVDCPDCGARVTEDADRPVIG